jgi:hypothetical protein
LIFFAVGFAQLLLSSRIIEKIYLCFSAVVADAAAFTAAVKWNRWAEPIGYDL